MKGAPQAQVFTGEDGGKEKGSGSKEGMNEVHVAHRWGQ